MGDQAAGMGYRRELLQAASEEDLLSQQSEFLSKNSQPSAKVTRVKRKPAGPSPQPQPETHGEENTAQHPDECPQSNIEGPETSTIITDVVEKATSPPAPPVLPPSAPQTAFPQATHRKMSKFALGRKAKQPTCSVTTSAPAPQPPPPVKDVITPIEQPISLRPSMGSPTQQASALTAKSSPSSGAPNPATSMPGPVNTPASSLMPTKSSMSGGNQSSKSERRVTFGDDVVGGLDPVLPVQPEEGCKSESELASIDKQNRSHVAAMSEEQRKEALEDLESRLSPAMLDFLKKRGASKLKGGAQPGVPTSKAAPLSTSLSGVSASNAPQKTPHTVSFTNPPPAMGTSGPAPPHNTASTVVRPAHKDTLADLLHTEEQEQDVVKEGGLPDERLVARVRFGLDGEPVGVQQSADLSLEQQVLRRDALRQDEGIVPSEGYTATELTVLARSSVSSQRVAALKLLSSLLAQAKPSVDDLDENGTLKRRPVCPPEGYAEKFLLDWGDVWQHMVAEVGIATTIRVALDDPVSTVVAAAAEALLVLVGAGAAEEVLGELMESMPIAGWPKLRLAQLKRPHAAGLWECALELSLHQERDGQRGPSEPWSEEDQTPEELAQSDPLAGLIQMALLPRIRHILLNRAAPTAVPYLLATLSHLAACSSLAAEYVASYPGILESLCTISESYATPAGESLHQQSKLGALRLVRVLTQSSSSAATSVQSAGLLQYPQRILMMANTEDGLHQLLMQLEAMRTWRAATTQGIPLMSMDDLYPYIAHCLLPPPRDSALELQEGGVALKGPSSAQQELRMEAAKWLLAAEGHLLLGSLLTHSACVHRGDTTLGPTMISSGAAAALVHEAREALTAASLQRLHRLLGTSSMHLFNTQTRHRGYIRLPYPALAVPTTSCAAAYTAAVMNCLAVYWQIYAATLKPEQVHPPSPSSLQKVGLSHSWTTPAVSPPLASRTQSPTTPTPQTALIGSSVLDTLLALATGAAVHVAPLSQIPTAAKLMCQAVGAALLQGNLLLLEAHHPDVRERWRAARGLLVPIMQHLQLNASQRKFGVKVMQPWVLSLLQARVPKLALLSTSVRVLKDCWRAVNGGMVLDDGRECSERQLSVWCVDAMAAVVALAPPGYELPCLNLLSATFSRVVMGPVLATADMALNEFSQVPGVLQRAAAGQTRHDAETQGAVMFPVPPFPSVDLLVRCLFHSYAATWLSFLNADQEPHQPATPATTSPPPAHTPVPALQSAYIPSTSTSRLPAPAYWMMKEAHALPQHLPAILQGQQATAAPPTATLGKDGTAESQSTAAAGVNVVGAAVLVCLGMEAAGSRYMRELPVDLKLQCLLHLCYIFDVLELVPADLKPSVHTSWTDPNVRWPLAALTQLLIHGTFTAASTNLSPAPPSLHTTTPSPASAAGMGQGTGMVDAGGSGTADDVGLEQVSTSTSGISGASGTSGISGMSGASDTSGTSGTAGTSDTAGTAISSTSGTAGTSGISGTSGASGTSGTSDTSGTSGTAGTPGTPGTSGVNSTNDGQILSSSTNDSKIHSSSINDSIPLSSSTTDSTVLSSSTMGSTALGGGTNENTVVLSGTSRSLSEPQLPMILPSAWATSSLAEQITDIFVSSSMLDPLFGAHMALLLMPVTGLELQPPTRRVRMTAPSQHAWNVMASEGVLHLLPQLEDCPGAPTVYEAVYGEESMLDLLVRAASSGDLDKAYNMGALPAWLATRSLAASLLGWTADDNVLRLRAESRLRSILRGAGPDVVRQLFEERCISNLPTCFRLFQVLSLQPVFSSKLTAVVYKLVEGHGALVEVHKHLPILTTRYMRACYQLASALDALAAGTELEGSGGSQPVIDPATARGEGEMRELCGSLSETLKQIVLT